MNRLSKEVSLVLISSALALGGCEEHFPDRIPINVKKPSPFPAGTAERAEKEDPQNAANPGTATANNPGVVSSPSGNAGNSLGSNTGYYSSGGHIYHNGIYHSTPIIFSGGSGLSGSSSTPSGLSSKGVSSVSGGHSGTSTSSHSSSTSSSSRGGFGSSAHGASSS